MPGYLIYPRLSVLDMGLGEFRPLQVSDYNIDAG